MNLVWVGLLFLSTSWLFLSEIFGPANWRLGVGFLACGVVLTIIGLKPVRLQGASASGIRRAMAPIGMGLFLSTAIFVSQAALLPLYFVFASRYHRVDVISLLIYPFLRLPGLDVSLSEGIIFVQPFRQLIPFTTNWEKLGLYPWLNIFLGSLLILFYFSPRAG